MLTQIGAFADLGDGTFLAKLRESPFYPDGGGQVTDAGELVHEGSGAVATLKAAYRIGDDQVLLLEGNGFAAGDRVRASRRVADALPDDGEPHGDASAAGGAARGSRGRSAPGGLVGTPRQAALRLHA